MKAYKEELQKPEHESTLVVQKTLKRKKRITKDIYENMVDVVAYCKNYCAIKGIEYDRFLPHEILTLDKRQIITYGRDKEGKEIVIKEK